jgi:hypothetical protein
MSNDRPDVKQRADGSLWLDVDTENPIHVAASSVEIVYERQRWMAAPQFSKDRYLAKPIQKNIGLFRALMVLIREGMRPRDDVGERLRDIEALIIAGHNDAADRQIDRLKADYPTEEMEMRVLGLHSLNLYDQGRAQEAQNVHEFAMQSGTAHPAMIEIFGDTVLGRWAD